MKSLGALKEVASAAVFGVGNELDTFNIAFTIASFFITITAGAIQIAQIPVYLETKQQQGKEAAQQLICITFTYFLLALFIIGISLYFLFPYVLPLIVKGFDVSKIETTQKIFYLLIPLIVLSSIILFITAILNAEEEFKFTALSPGWTGVSSILALILLGKAIGVYALVVGVIGGAIFELTFLIFLLHKFELKLHLTWEKNNKIIWRVARATAPIVLAFILSGVMPIIDQSFAANLSNGDVAALGFGYRVISLYVTLFAAAVGTTVLPHFSKLASEKDWTGLQQAFYGSLKKFIWPVCFVSSGLVIIFSEPIVRILFQRGAFTLQATKTVAAIQSMYALQLPAYVTVYVSFRLLSAINKNYYIIWIAVVSLTACCICDYIFSRFWGVNGIALAVSAVYWITAIVTLLIIKREMKQCELKVR